MRGVVCCAQHYTTPHIVTLHSVILDLERERDMIEKEKEKKKREMA